MRIVYQKIPLNWLAGRGCLVKNDDAGCTYKGERILQGTQTLSLTSAWLYQLAGDL